MHRRSDYVALKRNRRGLAQYAIDAHRRPSADEFGGIVLSVQNLAVAARLASCSRARGPMDFAHLKNM